MENFMTWETLKTYATFVATVYMVVEFTKALPFIKKIPTRYWSFLISLGLLITVNAVMNEFKWVDIVLYALSAISISLGSNGLSDFNKKSKEGE
jgi:hypothetical protein